ncbi:defective in methylation-7 protein [Ophiocordyceps camponoti-floridani]|uniref:Defective in methylation-7 protein n=1 Tax=Ophiocordyceps camponoti-floridani TaxID=2030778 RepID=A0A8H4VCW7_9HYPO|nr:defective in methylation-7 protein [Ophiocordyceps camponoti-floridani]
MTGRKRRASTSSVDSVDESQVRWRQEASIVRTVAKDLAADEWPVFELRDAVVFNRDGETLENALHVALRGPFMIRGHLIIDDPSQKIHLISRVRRSCPLEIRHSTRYSIGETEDGSPIIWVSGRGGWYEINPSPAYRQIFRKMCEATKLYYIMVDIYAPENAPKKNKKSTKSALLDELSGVFLQYAVRAGDGCTFEEVVARCHEHAAFLINQFPQETSIDWNSTAFHRWIMMEHADLVEKIDYVMRNPQIIHDIPIEKLSPAPRESTSRSSYESASVEVADSKQVPIRQRSRHASSLAPPPAEPTRSRTPAQTKPAEARTSREPLHAPKPIAPKPVEEAPKPVKEVTKPVKEVTKPMTPSTASRQTLSGSIAPPPSDGPAFESVFEALEGILDAACRGKKRKTITDTFVLNKFYFDYTLPSYKDGDRGSHKKPGQELLHYYAAPLLQRLDKAKYGGLAVYSWLEQLSCTEFQPVVFKPSDFPITLYQRTRKPRMLTKDAVQQPAPPSGPPPSLLLVKTAEERLYDDEEHDDGIEAEIISDATASRRGKTIKRHGRRKKSYLRPVAANKKRPHSQVDGDSDSDGLEPAPGTRTSHYISDNADDEYDDDVMEDAPASDDAQDNNANDDNNVQHTTVEPIALVVRADKIPDATPRGPDSTWVCDQDGCDYMVRASDDAEGRERIQAHFSEHAQQLERVSLAVTESRGHMPINHLLEKLKRMGEKSLPRRQEPSLPAPIKRKLIV